MTRLTPPDVRLRESLAATIADLDPDGMDGSGHWHFGAGGLDTSEDGIAATVETLRGFADPDRELGDEAWVHCDYLWITDGEPEQVIGFLAIRHTLNAFLLEQGGHIGYSVRASRRARGTPPARSPPRWTGPQSSASTGCW